MQLLAARLLDTRYINLPGNYSFPLPVLTETAGLCSTPFSILLADTLFIPNHKVSGLTGKVGNTIYSVWSHSQGPIFRFIENWAEDLCGIQFISNCLWGITLTGWDPVQYTCYNYEYVILYLCKLAEFQSIVHWPDTPCEMLNHPFCIHGYSCKWPGLQGSTWLQSIFQLEGKIERHMWFLHEVQKNSVTIGAFNME